MRVKIDLKKKLVRGERITIGAGGGGEQRWIAFKYERLPNFCYRCSMLSHGLHEYLQGKKDDFTDLSTLQYGAYLKGEVSRKGGG